MVSVKYYFDNTATQRSGYGSARQAAISVALIVGIDEGMSIPPSDAHLEMNAYASRSIIITRTITS